MERTGCDYLTDQGLADIWTFPVVAGECNDNSRLADDGFDFPPTAHPGRELFTFTLFVLLALQVCGGWNLISWILTSLH
jgi:hypothetical protein